MAKPSKRKASNRNRRPKSVAPKPEPTVEELKQEIAKFDHDGDGHPGGSLPKEAEAPETAAQAPSPGEPAAAPDDATVAQPQTIKLGPVECRLAQVKLGSVLGLLSSDELRRVEAHKGSPTFESTRQRLLATDGHATPVVFEAGGSKSDPPSILHGFEELAAAEVCGVPEIFVILVPAGEAVAAQSHIVEMVRKQRMTKQTSEDDDLLWRVRSE
jgi:hypothetical protein